MSERPDRNHSVITHIGVSALSCEALRHVQSQNYDYCIVEALTAENDYQEMLKAARQDLLRGLKRFWGQSLKPHQKRSASPAEIAALSLLQTEQRPDGAPPLPIDRLIFLRSDTRSGKFCADLLEHVFRDTDGDIPHGKGYPHFGDDRHLETLPINGLAITDERTPDPASSKQDFVRTGLTNYVKSVFAEYQKLTSGDTLTLNITSGFKGLVPIARDLALLLGTREDGPRIQMVYLYQSSSELVWYDPWPMHFNWNTLPIKLLRNAGTNDGAIDGIVESKDAYLFEHKEPRRLQRSAIGEVVWTLYTLLYPGSVDVPHDALH